MKEVDAFEARVIGIKKLIIGRINYGRDRLLTDFNGTRTHNYLVCKRTLNHLSNLAK